MEEHQYLPDTNRLSVLAATILLAYALTPFVKIPESLLVVTLPGVVFNFRLNFPTLVSILVAALAATGMNWILMDHPQLERQPTFQFWLIPALTALLIGVPLNSIELSTGWWAVFAFGGFLLVLVCVSEYIVVDISDVRHTPATMGLTAVSFAIFLVLAIAVQAADLRLYMALPALVISIYLVSLRTLYLRLGGRWCVGWALVIAAVVGQIAMGLHYWPLRPLASGLILTGPAYALTSLAGSIEEGRSWKTLWIEPALMTAILWSLAALVGR